MRQSSWTIESSNRALDFISEEYNRLEVFKDGLGERFFDEVEKIYTRLKRSPFEFREKTSIYRMALVNVTRRIQYAVYFRVEEEIVFVDLIFTPFSQDTSTSWSSILLFAKGIESL